MIKYKVLVLALAVSAALSSPVRASDPAGLAACQASAQANLHHAIALCDQRGLGYSCQQDAESQYQRAWADCANRYG
jgi:hypothetical protein